jgi:hypothetical protein
MEYDPSFTGGVLNGTVTVPASVFEQLAARNTSYPVPWDPGMDVPIAWLVPGRLIAFIDSGNALGPGLTIPATLNGEPLPVQPVWSCRSLQRVDCFSGYWLDLTAAGVQADQAYSLSITIPAGQTAGTFQGVYYDNVDAIYAQA